MNINLDKYNSNEIKERMTFGELLNFMNEEIDNYKKLGLLYELLNAPLSLELQDKNAHVLYGDCHLSAGFLQNNCFHIGGLINHIYEQK